MSDRISAKVAAAILGISARAVYDRAAPKGPIPCTRIGERVIFDRQDIEGYKEKCRYTETVKAVRSSLNSTATSPAPDVSALASAFRKLGIKPKLTPTTGKGRLKSTLSPAASSEPSTPSRKLSLVTCETESHN